MKVWQVRQLITFLSEGGRNWGSGWPWLSLVPGLINEVVSDSKAGSQGKKGEREEDRGQSTSETTCEGGRLPGRNTEPEICPEKRFKKSDKSRKYITINVHNNNIERHIHLSDLNPIIHRCTKFMEQNKRSKVQPAMALSLQAHYLACCFSFSLNVCCSLGNSSLKRQRLQPQPSTPDYCSERLRKPDGR